MHLQHWIYSPEGKKFCPLLYKDKCAIRCLQVIIEYIENGSEGNVVMNEICINAKHKKRKGNFGGLSQQIERTTKAYLTKFLKFNSLPLLTLKNHPTQCTHARAHTHTTYTLKSIQV